mmetsp:Transcript_7284/g.18408  ORF Transcript_7284/g.18408 Transcript_7284/m.18408 type:complete len:97 (+) Transcript_7284:1955-2245(+)
MTDCFAGGGAASGGGAPSALALAKFDVPGRAAALTLALDGGLAAGGPLEGGRGVGPLVVDAAMGAAPPDLAGVVMAAPPDFAGRGKRVFRKPPSCW